MGKEDLKNQAAEVLKRFIEASKKKPLKILKMILNLILILAFVGILSGFLDYSNKKKLIWIMKIKTLLNVMNVEIICQKIFQSYFPVIFTAKIVRLKIYILFLR